MPVEPVVDADKQRKEIVTRTKAATPLVEGKGLVCHGKGTLPSSQA